MKRDVKFARRSAFFRFALLLLLCMCGAFVWLTAAQAQSDNNQQGPRGLGLPAQTPTPPQPPTNAQGNTISKPELVLQTGYPYAIELRMLFSPDGRLLATTTMNSSNASSRWTACRERVRASSGVPSRVSVLMARQAAELSGAKAGQIETKTRPSPRKGAALSQAPVRSSASRPITVGD